MKKAFFLDRDGTINVDYNFVHSPKEWTWCEGAVEAIRWMNSNNYTVIVVTNQSGIVRGRYSEESVHHLHRWVDRQLSKQGAFVDDWYIAPHHPEYDDIPFSYAPEDRKPNTGMFLKAARKHDIDFNHSYMAGDKISDLKPAVELGITTFFIRSRHAPDQDDQWLREHNVPSFDNIKDVVETL